MSGKIVLSLSAAIMVAFCLSTGAAHAQGVADANGRCTILTDGPDFGKAMSYRADPAPRFGVPCAVGNLRGFVSASVSPGKFDANADCLIVSQANPNLSVHVPYHGDPAPADGAACAVGGFRGTIDRTSAAQRNVTPNTSAPMGQRVENAPAEDVTAQCTILSDGAHFGTVIPIRSKHVPPDGVTCWNVKERGFVSRSSAPGNTDFNAVCRIVSKADPTKFADVPYRGNPAPALGTPCTVAGVFHGQIDRTSAASVPQARLGCKIAGGPHGAEFPARPVTIGEVESAYEVYANHPNAVGEACFDAQGNVGRVVNVGS